MDNFVKTLIEEVKSQGVFDEFRFNCCLADVDTKPAYQNVRTRVETAVKDFLAKQQWTPETNKVQLRERLRKHLLDSDVLDKGVDHIVDQVVNPKVATIFEPKIESIAYKYLGITPPPPPTNPPPRPPLLPAPPLPAYSGHHMGHLNGANILKVETTTASLLPTDLEQISPDSDRETIKSELKEDSKDDDRPPGVDNDDYFDDDDDDAASPPFEPVGSIKEETNIASLNTSDSFKDIKELLNDSPDAGASQSSQLSQVSSDSRLTITSIDVPQQTSTNNSNMAANMSEEAQMPKFNENSSDENNCGRQLHFDIKQDPITFEGTDRRNSMSDSTNGGANTLSIEQAIMCEVTANLQSDNISTENTTPKLLADQPSESLEAKPGAVTESNFAMFADSATESLNPKESEIIEPQEPLPCGLEATPTVPLAIEPEIQPEVAKADVEKPAIDEVASATLTIASDEIKDDEIKSADLITSPASACSSQLTKKHSHSKDKEKRHHSHHHSRSDGKQRRKSRDRERDKSRSKTSSSKHSSHNSSHSSSSKHRSSSSSKNEKSSTSTTFSRSTHESSSSKRSSSRHESSSHKKHKSSSSSRSDRDRDRSRDSRESHSHSHSHSRSHNGSSSSKKSDRDRDRDRNKSSSNSTTTSIAALIQDDHNEEKAKLLKRHSNDSNDEGKPPGSFNKSPAESTHAESKENKTAENGKEPETNGKSNGSNGNHNQATAELMAATSVIVVSDMLQQSTVNFVDITSAGLAQKLKAEVETPTNEVETGSKLPEQSSEPIAEESKCESPATVVETEIKPEEQPDVPCETTNEVDADKAVEETVKEPFVAAEVKHTADELSEEAVKDHLEESVTEPVKEPVTESEVELSVDKTSAAIDVPSVSESSKDSLTKSDTAVVKEPESETGSATSEDTPDSEVSKPFTHFEDDEDLFKERLLLIEQHIKDRRQLLNVLNEFEDTNCLRRSPAKRRLSSEASSMSKPHSSSSGNSSSSCAGSPAKRARPADAAKTSPTPSEVSVNSKENEELEKHEKDAVTTKRLTQKQCQQQRYSNDDLYKPRPLLSQRSRRRGLDSIL